MTLTKILTITNDELDEIKKRPQILTLPKFYKLFETINVPVDNPNAKIPSFFEDLDRNSDLCELPESTMSQVLEIVKKLEEFKDKFKALSEQYIQNSFAIEKEAMEFLEGLAEDKKQKTELKHFVFKPLSFNFKNKDGEAEFSVEFSFPFDDPNKKESYPVNPQVQPLEVETIALPDNGIEQQENVSN